MFGKQGLRGFQFEKDLIVYYEIGTIFADDMATKRDRKGTLFFDAMALGVEGYLHRSSIHCFHKAVT